MNKQVEFSPEQYAVLKEAVDGAIRQTRAERTQPVPDNLFTGCNVYITANNTPTEVVEANEPVVNNADSKFLIDLRSLPNRQELLNFIIGFITRISLEKKSTSQRRVELEKEYRQVSQLAKGDTSTDLIKTEFSQFVATLYGLAASLGALTNFEETNGEN